MGVDNMVMMVKINATPSVLEEMRSSFVMKAPLKDDRYDWQIYRASKEMKIMNNKLMIWRTDSGIVHPSSSSPLGHWAIMSHLTKKC